METISYTKVCNNHVPVIITRQTSNPVVMLSLEDYQALEETAYLLRSSKNAARLTGAIEEIEAGKARVRTLSE